MSIKIDISLCRVCLKQGPGTNIYTGNILQKFQFTTLVQVSKYRRKLFYYTQTAAILLFILFATFISSLLLWSVAHCIALEWFRIEQKYFATIWINSTRCVHWFIDIEVVLSVIG